MGWESWDATKVALLLRERESWGSRAGAARSLVACSSTITNLHPPSSAPKESEAVHPSLPSSLPPFLPLPSSPFSSTSLQRTVARKITPGRELSWKRGRARRAMPSAPSSGYPTHLIKNIFGCIVYVLSQSSLFFCSRESAHFEGGGRGEQRTRTTMVRVKI